MLKNKKLILGSIIALALIIIVVISFLFNKLNSQPTLNYATDIKEIESSNKAEAEAEIKLKPQDFTVGNISAPVQIVAYDSFSCPHCATFMNRVFPELEEKYIKTGKVLFIHREFPLDLQSLQATKLLRCFSTNNGSNVKVFDVIKSLFQSQTEWLSATEYERKLIEIFNFAGLSKKDATACIANKELETNKSSFFQLLHGSNIFFFLSPTLPALSLKSHSRPDSQTVSRRLQCDQIWRNFANLPNIYKSLAKC